jgi:hypothetical protein
MFWSTWKKGYLTELPRYVLTNFDFDTWCKTQYRSMFTKDFRIILSNIESMVLQYYNPLISWISVTGRFWPFVGLLLWIPFTQGWFVPSLVTIDPMVLEEKIFKFLHFCDYLPFVDDLALYLNKFKFPSSKDNLYQVWLILACWFWRRRF